MPIPDDLFDDKGANQTLPDLVFEESKPAEKSKLKAALIGAANAPMIMTPEVYAKGIRALTGREEPYPFEKYTPTPTWGRFVKGLLSPVEKVVQLGGNVVGLGGVVNPAVTGIENFYKENVAPSLSGEVAGFVAPAVLSGGTSLAPEAANASRLATGIRSLLNAYRTAGTAGGAGEAALASIGRAALQGGAVAAVSTPVPNAESAADVFKETGKQALIGGAFGGAMGAVGPLASSVASGIRDYMQTKIDPLKATSIIDDAIAASSASGKPMTMKPSTVYFGSKKQPQTVEEYAANARAFDESLSKEFRQTPFKNLGEIEAAAADPSNPYNKKATVLLEGIKESFGSAAETLPKSLQISALNEKLRINALGQAKDALAEGVTGRFTNAADEVAKQIKAVGSDLLKPKGQKDAELAYLRNLESSLRGPEKGATSWMGQEPNLPSFQQGTKAIQTINDDLSKVYRGENLVTGSGDAAFLKRFKDAIRKDQTIMAEFSGKNDLIAMTRRFNEEYGKYAGTWKDPAILTALSSNNYNEIIAGLTKAGKDKAAKVFNQMEPRGQAAFMSHSYNTALDGATDKATGQFSPEKFVEALRGQFDNLSLTRDQRIKDRVAGLVNIGEAINLGRGTTQVPLGAIGTEGAWSFGGSKYAHALRLADRMKAHGIDFLFDHPGGMDFLFKAGKLSPKDPALWDLMEKMGRRVVPVTETLTKESK